MKIFGLGMPELLIILGVALLIFGPKHLPKLGASLGKTIKNLRDGISGGESSKATEAEEEEAEPAPKRKKKLAAASTTSSTESSVEEAATVQG